MIYERNLSAILVFAAIVGVTLGLSVWLGRRARSASGFFAAGGGIHWFVNGVAFAGDYLSAASFLGICGMIAFYGYDGFLYSIGYLAGWVVALFVVAEPLKRLGKYTFADALDAKFHSPAIKLAAGISTLAVSVFYLIPQMVGAGVLVTPLFGLDHWVGVVMVGTVVIFIVVTAGMVSTTYVQFLKGGLLVVFSAVLVVLILNRGLTTEPAASGSEALHMFGPFEPDANDPSRPRAFGLVDSRDVPADGGWVGKPYLRVDEYVSGPRPVRSVWRVSKGEDGRITLSESQTVTEKDGRVLLVNGLPRGTGEGQGDLRSVGRVLELPDGATRTGPLGPAEFLGALERSRVELWRNEKVAEADGSTTTVYYPVPTSGAQALRPGNLPAFAGIRGDKLTDKLNFLSLMLALFCGTASLPHILIRYYTVRDQAAARKSTIVGIATIGFFYVLTLYLGLGAMTSGALDPTNDNMAAPLLARSFSPWLFAVVSAIAFTTVLGTVSGLIIAASGAVVHDLIVSVLKVEMSDDSKVRVARVASVAVGAVAIVLGILFGGMNVTYLVGWAFSVAASANLPALVMLLFWKGTTKQGVASAVIVGMVSSLAWILLSADTFKNVYKLPPGDALVPFSQPGIVTIPLGFLTLVVVSLMTRRGRGVRGESS